MLAILASVVPVFAAVAGGAFMRWMGWLNREADESLLRLGINLLFPAFILGSIIDSEALNRKDVLIIAPVTAFLLVTGGITLARWVGRWIRLNDEDSRSFGFAAGMFNYGFIAIPLAFSVFGKDTVGILFVFNLGVEMAMWSVGVRTLTGGAPQPGAWKKMFSPPVLAIILGVVINQLGGGEWVPAPLMRSCEFLGAAAIPIALIITGAVLADVTSRETLKKGLHVVVAAVGLRNVLFPALFLLVAAWLAQPVELQNVLITQSAMPAAMAPLMLARFYRINPVPAMLVVVATSLASVITIPLWITVGRWLLQGA